MRSFSCPVCGRMAFFEHTRCLTCATPLGYDPGRRRLVAADPTGAWVRCANADLAGCNWVLPAHRPATAPTASTAPTAPTASSAPTAPDTSRLCRSCALTRTRPVDGDEAGLEAFADAEAAKRRLVFQLDELGLPIIDRFTDPEGGLTFDLLSSSQDPVTTGHAGGVITIDLAESDDAHREKLRHDLGEDYRTMLGHFRHEVGHWYWGMLVRRAGLTEEFRGRFGDERADYAGAVDRHYELGPPPGWSDAHVSAYASMHPWEDWAETFAHILHIRDALQTAAAFGMIVAGPLDERTGRRDVSLASVPLPDDADPGRTADFGEMLDQWLPLTHALNSVNRSMGLKDLYPFVLPPVVVAKMAWVQQQVNAASRALP